MSDLDPSASAETPQDPLLIRIDLLAPHEVVALYAHLVAQESDRPDMRSLADTVTSAIAGLPGSDVERARQVYAAFVNSPSEIDRRHSVVFMPELTREDRLSGLRLWHQLVRDPSRTVRVNAYGLLGDCMGGGNRDTAEVARARMGITWYDIAQLLDAYIRAECGSTHDLGSLALGKALWGETEDSPFDEQPDR